MAMENGRNLTEKFLDELIMNRQLKKYFRILGRKKDRTVVCDAIYFCVSVSSCYVLVHMLTSVHECFIGKEYTYYKNGKSEYIEFSYKEKLTIGE